MRTLALLAAALLAGCSATTQVELELGAFANGGAVRRRGPAPDASGNQVSIDDICRPELIDLRECEVDGLALVERAGRPPLAVGSAPFTLLRPPIAVVFESDDPDEPDVRVDLTEPRVALGPVEGARCSAGTPLSRTLRIDLPMRVARATVRIDAPGYDRLEHTLEGDAARSGVYVVLMYIPGAR